MADSGTPFAAHARTDIPALLTALDEQDAMIARLVGALTTIREYERNEDNAARDYGVLEPDLDGYCFALADSALADPQVAVLTANAPDAQGV